MRVVIRTVLGLSAVALLLGASNCTKNNASDAPQFVTTLTVEDISGQTSTAFARGQTIQFVLTIRSRSVQSQSLFFNSSELLNLAVVDLGTASVVWTCDGDASSVTTPSCTINDNGLGKPASGGSGFNEMDFAPFETKTVTVTWNQANNAGNQVAGNDGGTAITDTTGKYEVMGGFTVYNTKGPGNAADNGSSMAEGAPTAGQLFPSVYRSTLSPFTIH
ncbi:MAG TPA: hypothetical protein VLV87_01255 [Gammaproteobacteria bacterium]|nr:hypothetical protein [Gammaproteobacteria bacterium]